jgi:methylated-DNA-protein-cysteine methyltransferase-like protein
MSGLNRYVSRVFKYLQSLPKGKMTTYGAIAKKFGIPNPRNVGWILQQNNDPDKVPCYKVVRADGRLANGYKFGGPSAQKKRLLSDGVDFQTSIQVSSKCVR